jgi:purine nucleosidase
VSPPRRIVLDTDLGMGNPGSDIDDGFALALALADPDIRLELVTTVGGNADVDTCTTLSRELLARLGRSDVPVVGGASVPLGGGAGRRDDEHRAPYAAPALVEHLRNSPGEITLVAIGPLTNVALALLLEPALARDVREIVVMGGVYLGHTNLIAMPGEYNIWCDPDAAAVVLGSGAPLRFVGLDVTKQVRLSRNDAAALAASGSDFGRFAAECTSAWIDIHGAGLPGDPLEQDSCALHDPLAVAVVTRPDLVTWTPAFVAVETAGRVTRGMMVADLLTSADPPRPNCEIGTAVDADAFTDLFLERIASL